MTRSDGCVIGSASQQRLSNSLLLGNDAGLTGNSVDLQLDGIHAVVALTIDVIGNTSDIQTSDVTVTYKTVSWSATWMSATVLHVSYTCTYMHNIHSHSLIAKKTLRYIYRGHYRL